MTATTLGTPLEPVGRRSIYLQAQESIKDYIVSNNLVSGDQLPPEGTLARHLGVSRNSVREAIKALETIGVVASRRGTGLFVGDFTFDVILDNLPYGLQSDMKELSDLLEVRRILELGLAGRVLELVDEEQLGRIRHVLQQMRAKAEAGEPFPNEDRAFHREMYARVDNRVLAKLIDVFWHAHYRTASSKDIHDPNPMATFDMHAAILTALEARNEERLRTKIDRHYDGIYERLGSR